MEGQTGSKVFTQAVVGSHRRSFLNITSVLKEEKLKQINKQKGSQAGQPHPAFWLWWEHSVSEPPWVSVQGELSDVIVHS